MKISTMILSAALLLIVFNITSCSSETRKVNFVQLCHDENPGRQGLPLSQVDLLYEGVKNANDMSARQTLLENCPKAAAGYLK